MRAVFVPCNFRKDLKFEKSLSVLKGHERIGLLATAQHLHALDEMKAFLESNGKKAVIGGQILGCNLDRMDKLSDVDCFLYIGSGRFHPLGMSQRTDKPVFILNPYSGGIDRIGEDEKKSWAKRKTAKMSKFLIAEKIGIVVSTRDGQFDLKKAMSVRDKMKADGKEALVFAGDDITPDNLLPFKVDAWVNTACPRIADDHFDKPVVNAGDLE